MFLKKVRGSHFRIYDQFSLSFSSPINIFCGENGQGKSSLLEAIYCALKGKSFYPFVQFQFIQHQKSGAGISLDIEEKRGSSEVSASFFAKEGETLKREMRYCGKKTSPAFLSKKFPCLVFTEESMKCLRSGPEQRRIFIDNLLKAGSLRVKEQFNKVLMEKKSLLKSFKKGLLSFQEAGLVLEALNEKFLKLSILLVQERMSALNDLFFRMKNVKNDFFKEEAPDLGFEYFLSKRERLSDKSWMDFMREELARKRDMELQCGLPLCGPQKHEIRFLYNGKDSRFFCSKGQQRLFLLSLMGSFIHQDSEIFLFLDDVLLELDEKSQKYFLQFLEKKHCQTFLTSCNLISFGAKKTSLFSIKSGTVERI